MNDVQYNAILEEARVKWRKYNSGQTDGSPRDDLEYWIALIAFHTGVEEAEDLAFKSERA